jgi:hypothetical protein
VIADMDMPSVPSVPGWPVSTVRRLCSSARVTHSLESKRIEWAAAAAAQQNVRQCTLMIVGFQVCSTSTVLRNAQQLSPADNTFCMLLVPLLYT